MRRLLLAPLLLLAIVSTACSVSLGEGDAATTRGADVFASPIKAGKEPVAAVVNRVLPSVVNVTTDIFTSDQFGNAQEGQGVGTGFIVRSDGVIVTNCHVVEGASSITVFSSDAEPKEYDARLIGADCLHDLAVLKIDETDLPTLELGASETLALGQRVVAIGYALALEGGPSVTTGIVSSLDRTIRAQDPQCETCPTQGNPPTPYRTYSDVIQTDAAINHGNSGGPLVDMQGRVVGINSAGDDQAENIGFAIAIDSAKDTISKAEEAPLAPTSYLGVSTQTVTADLALQQDLPVDEGAYIAATTSDGPAAASGMEEGDVIVSIDGRDVASAGDVGSILDSIRPGTEVAVVVAGASGERRTLDVTLGERPLPVDIP